MNNLPSSTAADDIAAEWAAMHSLHALDGEGAAAMEHCRACNFRDAAAAMVDSDLTVGLMAAACFPPVPAPADSKAIIMARIAGEKQAAAQPEDGKRPPVLRKAGDDDWVPLPGGKIRMRVLSDLPNAAHTLLLIDVDPGGAFAPHTHKGAEEIYVIRGECESDGLVLKAGDYLRMEGGSHHHVISPNGCRAMVITARENHPRVTVGLCAWLGRRLRAVSRKAPPVGG